MDNESDIIERRFGDIAAARRRSSLSRTSLYNLAAKHPGLFIKFGAATRVNFALLDQIMDGLPHARIKAASRRS